MFGFGKILWGVIGVSMLSIPLFSQAPLTLSIDPPSIKSSAKPGQNITKMIAVENPTNKTVKVKIYAQDWEYLSDGSKSFLPLGSTKTSMKDQIQLFANEIFLKPKESQNIFVRLASPKDSKGGLVSVVFFEAWPVSSLPTKSNVKLIGRVGTIIYHEIEGTVTHNLLATLPKEIASQEELVVSVGIENRGNVVEHEPISFLLISPTKQVINRVTLNSIKLMPFDKVKIDVPFGKNIKPGKYSAIVSFQTATGPLFSKSELVVK